MKLEAVKSSYARWAPIYDTTFGAATNVARRRAVDYVNGLAGADVLEVGVGTGLALPLYGADRRVTGIDYSEEMLKKARAKVRDLGLQNVTGLRQMDARALDFPSESFDTVVAMHILSVVPDPVQVVAEMARVCRPGGRVVITNHFARETGLLSVVERISAPFANVLGWHSDFEIDTVLRDPRLRVIEQYPLPPMAMMTMLVMEKI